jgi:hypothetical protein
MLLTFKLSGSALGGCCQGGMGEWFNVTATIQLHLTERVFQQHTLLKRCTASHFGDAAEIWRCTTAARQAAACWVIQLACYLIL